MQPLTNLSPVLLLPSTTFLNDVMIVTTLMKKLYDSPLVSHTQVYSRPCDWVQSAAEANETSGTGVHATPEQTRCKCNVAHQW